MLLDVRTYTCRPGTIKKHLELYEKYGKKPQSKHLGNPLAYMTTETGDPNQYVHIWVYKDAADRARKRAAMQADKDWVKYTQESAKLGALASQENKLMVPVGFYPEPKTTAAKPTAAAARKPAAATRKRAAPTTRKKR